MKIIVDPEAKKALDYLIDMSLRYDGTNAYRVVSSLEGNVQVFKNMHITDKQENVENKNKGEVKGPQSQK